MPYKQTDEASRDEHAVIGGVSGKKVFVVDNVGNQITQFGTATIAFFPYSYYKQASLVSGYTFHGIAAVGSDPATESFRVQRETLNTGEVLFGGGSPQFIHIWSTASLASISYS